MSWLRIEDLSVEVQGRLILKNFFLTINKGEVHVLLGPNGSGKTTLIKAILGFKNYKIISGKIHFKGKNIINLPIEERIKLGIGVLFQHPPAIEGVKLSKLLDICSQIQFDKNNINQNINNFDADANVDEDGTNNYLNQLASRLNFSNSYLKRDINVGFSGGEVKRSEILQMMVMKPDLLLFDEPDSGVDLENIELIAEIMRELLDRNKIPAKQEKSGLIITHLGYILKFLGHITRAHVIMDGSISCSGDPSRIINSIMQNGFEGCKKCLSCAENLSEVVEVDFTL